MPIPTYLQLDYIDQCINQTLNWINGQSIHANNECCIDFSCCYPNLLMEYSKRLEIGNSKLDELFARRRKISFEKV